MTSILERLTGGDLRSIGRSNEVAEAILQTPALFAEVFEGLFHADPRVRMRAADALEKVSSQRPDLLLPFKTRLLREAALSSQQEVQWHVAQMLAYLPLDADEQSEAVLILYGYLDTSHSRIVQVSAMQTLADLAAKTPAARPDIIRKLQSQIEAGSPAVVSRGKKLLARLTKASEIS